MATISDNLQAVKSRIAAAARAAGRNPEDIKLIAVSKTFGPPEIRAAAAAGQHAFGESYVQESLPKLAELADLGLEWHFVGPLQGNKTRAVAENFAWVHSVDRWKIAQRLAQQRPETRGVLHVCMQVNVSGEASKAGVAPDAARELAQELARLPRLKLRGLMAIPEPTHDRERQRRRFAELRRLQEALCRDGLELDTLSMGMSDDLEAAILEGATMVRVGTAIFGERPAAG